MRRNGQGDERQGEGGLADHDGLPKAAGGGTPPRGS
jgi:hypothetical protein